MIYRVWLEDDVEPLGGFWWYAELDKNGYLRQLNFDYTGKENELCTLQSFIDEGYKIEKI